MYVCVVRDRCEGTPTTREDMSGKLVKTDKVSEGELDLTSLENGVYIISNLDGNFNNKIIIIK